MLLAEYIKNDHKEEMEPLYRMTNSFLAYYDKKDLIKRFAKTDVFINKSIIIADRVNEEILKNKAFENYESALDMTENSIILFSFEFAKFNPKTQNTLLIKKDSDIYNVFKEIKPDKIKRLRAVKTPFNKEMLSGIAVDDIEVFSHAPSSGCYVYSRIEKEHLNRYKENLYNEAISNGTNKFTLNGVDIYTYPILNMINFEDIEFRIKDNLNLS